MSTNSYERRRYLCPLTAMKEGVISVASTIVDRGQTPLRPR